MDAEKRSPGVGCSGHESDTFVSNAPQSRARGNFSAQVLCLMIKTMSEPNEQTIRDAAQGDLEAFSELYEGYSFMVYNIAFRMVRDREEAEEITQEVFLTLHRKLHQFQFQSTLKTWIHRITVNTTLNAIARQQREAEKQRGIELELSRQPSPPSTEATVEDALSDELEEEAMALLMLLPVEQRACLVLRSIVGFSYEEIAEALQINLNTVRSRLKRARATLLVAKQNERIGTADGGTASPTEEL